MAVQYIIYACGDYIYIEYYTTIGCTIDKYIYIVLWKKRTIYVYVDIYKNQVKIKNPMFY